MPFEDGRQRCMLMRVPPTEGADDSSLAPHDFVISSDKEALQTRPHN